MARNPDIVDAPPASGNGKEEDFDELLAKAKRQQAAKNPEQRDLSGERQSTFKSKKNGSWQTDDSNGVHVEDTERNRESDKEGSYTRKSEHIKVKIHEKDREKEKAKQHERDMERARASRQPASRVIVNNRMGGRGRQQNEGIDFSQGFISSGLGGAEGYSSPFRGMSLGAGLGMGRMEVGRMSLGLGGMSRGAYADPFRGIGIGMQSKSPLNMSGGIFDRGSGRSLLTDGVFSGKMPSLFGGAAPAPTRRKAPAKKKPSTRGKPVVYGNAAARGGAVIIQKGKKTTKVPVKKLPARRKTRR